MLKKIFTISLCLSLSYLNYNLKGYTEEISMEGVTNADVLNVRKDPDSKASIITSVKKDAKIKIIASNNDKTWYQVLANDKKGWVDKKYLQINIKGNIDYKTVSTLGNTKEQGVLHNALKIAFNSKYKFVLDAGDKINLNIYDFNNNFVSNIPLTYIWAVNKVDINSIVLAADDEMNFYTNNTDKNTITKYDIKGIKVGSIKPEIAGDVSYIAYDNFDGTLYSLDKPNKNIKGFNKAGLNTKNIFLSETRIAKNFNVDKGKVYVLDYPENEKETYPIYYVNSYSYVLRGNYDPDAAIVENVSKGSILKSAIDAKTFKSKTLLKDDPSKVKETNWLDFSETNKKYGIVEELKKVNVIGEIDIYKSSGEPISTISLNQKWLLKSPDRHRNTANNDLSQIIQGVGINKDGNVVLPVMTKSKSTNVSTFNYYYLNTNDNSYKISQPLPFNDTNYFLFNVINNDIYTINARKYITVLNENGIERESLGRISPYKFNLAEKLSINNNMMFIFDRGNSSFGEYDLNGDAIKVKTVDQKTDLFDWSDVFFTSNNFVMLKTLEAEDKKLGVEIYDLALNKTFDRWLITLSSENYSPKVAMNENKEVFIAAKGNYYNKKVFLSVFNDKGYLINSWSKEPDLINFFSDIELSNIRENSLKFLGFDDEANIYLLLCSKANKYRIDKIKVHTDGTGEVLKAFDLNFFGDLIAVEKSKEDKATEKDKIEVIAQRKFSGSINGDILNIKTGKNGFTYFMHKDIFSKEIRLGLYDPSGTFWKEFTLFDYPDTTGFTLDSQDNVWIAQGTSLKKLATYK
ncbi:MAG: SH3 domain-containing protein [Candidatus Sericytochromatia bacterium]|nr:SH3 domain-containing protein [Candidatus Sericytochromatia bacterium]